MTNEDLKRFYPTHEKEDKANGFVRYDKDGRLSGEGIIEEVDNIVVPYSIDSLTYDMENTCKIYGKATIMYADGEETMADVEITLPILPGDGITMDATSTNNALTVKLDVETKTLFGKYSVLAPMNSAGDNYDIYLHVVSLTYTDTSTSTTTKWILQDIMSSNNISVDSWTDLKTLIGERPSVPCYKLDPAEPVTGYLLLENMTIYYMKGSETMSVLVSAYDIDETLTTI